MAITITKSLLGKNDIRFYTSASPTFSRTTSTGGATNVTALAATHIPVVQGAASLYFSQNTTQRAITETISRHHGKDHSTATYNAGARVGDHLNMMGFRNALAATSIQAAASNAFLRDGVARLIIPNSTTTAATPIQLARRTFIFGNGRGTVIRASSTIQTSRVFSISGQVSGTNSALTANATIGTQTVFVASGAKFSKGNWMIVRDSKNAELQEVSSVSGNTVTVAGILGHTYRSAATTAHASLVYPAELYMDNLDIQLTSATQGYGIAATYMVRSYIGKNVRISGHAREAVKGFQSADNVIEPQIFRPSSTSSGKGYGVRLANFSHDNVLGGYRDGSTKDSSDGGSIRNIIWGVNWRGTYEASGIPDPMAYMYRQNKPELSYTTYSVSGTATTVVTIPASTSKPADVFINGRVYRNTGIVMADLSRTKTPSNATVGGLDRGPATATRAYYVYAVPSQNPSATRQWDPVISSQSAATGPLASATYPVWSLLGAVNTGATIRLIPFAQSANRFVFNYYDQTLVSSNQPTALNATYKQARLSSFPVGTKTVLLVAIHSSTAVTSNPLFSVFYAHGDTTNVNSYTSFSRSSGWNSGTQSVGSATDIEVPVNSNRFIAYRVASAATVTLGVRFKGFVLDRAGFK